MILKTSNLPDQKICFLPTLWSMTEPEEEKRQWVWKRSCVGPGREEERSSTLPLCRTGASEGTKHAIRATMHSEVVITRANECAIAPWIKVHANERLFIIGEHNSSHNPISCLAICMAEKEEMLNLDGKEYPNKVLAKRLSWKLGNSDAQILLLTIPIQTHRLLLSVWVGGHHGHFLHTSFYRHIF